MSIHTSWKSTHYATTNLRFTFYCAWSSSMLIIKSSILYDIIYRSIYIFNQLLEVQIETSFERVKSDTKSYFIAFLSWSPKTSRCCLFIENLSYFCTHLAVFLCTSNIRLSDSRLRLRRSIPTKTLTQWLASQVLRHWCKIRHWQLFRLIRVVTKELIY